MMDSRTTHAVYCSIPRAAIRVDVRDPYYVGDFRDEQEWPLELMPTH